jgi:hypothetical protein
MHGNYIVIPHRSTKKRDVQKKKKKKTPRQKH